MFSQIYFRNSLKDWLLSLAIIAGAIAVNLIISWINNLLFKPLALKTTHKFDDEMFDRLESPLKFAVMLLAVWIASSRLDMADNVYAFLLKAYKFLIVLNVTWFVERIVDAFMLNLLMPAAKGIRKKKDSLTKKSQSEKEKDMKKEKKEAAAYEYFDNTLLPVIRRVVLGVVWTIGIMTSLNNVGVDVGALLAGLGIGGLAFALAAQDTLKNIFGGLTILTDQPFKIGDRIKVDGFDGVVETIGIRSTRIRTLEKRLVTIPNYKMGDISIENITREPMRRVLIKIGLTYDTSPEKMRKAIEILKNVPNAVEEVDRENLQAVFSDFSSSSMDITFIYWVTAAGNVMETPSKVNFEILDAFNREGLNFAFPSQTIYLNREI
jgi:MscS family membrane protein